MTKIKMAINMINGFAKTTGPVVFLAVSSFAQVASLPIREMSGAQQTARPFSLAQAFKQGDIAAQPKPRINGIAATQWQADVRNRWPDGSVKFAVISFHADLPASSTIVVDYISSTDYCHLGTLATCQAAALDGAGMLAQRGAAWTGTIEITNGTTQTANARTLINAGKFTYWLRGPIVTQMIVRDPTRASDMGFTLFNGSAIASLHPIFVITAYPAYTAGIRQEFILENSWADNNVDQTYSLAIKNGAGGATTQYSRASFLHYPGARWHKGNDGTQIWDGTAPGAVEFKWNIPYLIASKALPNYDPAITVGATTIASLTSIYNASDKGDDFGDTATVQKAMGTTGGRPDIGFVHQHQLRALYTQSSTLMPFFHNLGDVAGHVAAMHYRETRTDNYYCGYSCTGANALVAGTDRHVTRDGRRTLYGRNISPSVVLGADRILTGMSGTGATGNNLVLTATQPNAFATGITDGVTQIFIFCPSATPSACSSTFYGAGARTIVSHTNNTVTLNSFLTSTGTNFSWYIVQTTAGWSFENSHSPSLNYIPYLITGSWWNYDELMWWSQWTMASEEPSHGYYGQMYEWSLPNPYSVRTAGWQIRTVGQAAFFAIDGSPEQESMLKKLEWAAEYWEGIYGITAGNYPPGSTACPGYTNLGSSPTDANKNRWCFGYKSASESKSNPIGIGYARVDVPNHCRGTYYSKFNCDNVSANLFGNMWMNGYLDLAMGWVNEAVASYFSKVVELRQKFAIDLTFQNNGSTYAYLGGMYSYRPPALQPDQNYASSFSMLNGMIEKVGSTTSTSAITTTDTSFTVTDYTQITWKPIWKRTAATAKSITGLSVAAGVITITFSHPHGLTVNDIILTSGHTTAAFNTNSSGGAPIATRFITGTPTSNSLTYNYVGTTAPADGTYAIGSMFAMTPAAENVLIIENENIHVCGIETDGTITIGSSVGTTAGGTQTNAVCTPVANYATRGTHGSTAASHASGVTVTPGYRLWETASNAEHGYNWIGRAAYSFMWPYTTASSTGSAAWGWINTYMDSVWLSSFRAAENPTWSVQPRQAPGLIITTSGLPSGVVSSAYSATLAATGNTGAVTWSLPSGSLPAGMSLSSGGVISGTPGAAAATTVTVRATDSTGYRDATFGLGIAASGVVITISPTSLTSGTVGTAYSQTLTASGGTAPYSWAVLGGGLPPGLSLSASGNLTGTPTTGGTYNFTVRATDSLSNTKDQSYTLVIAWLTLTITTTSPLSTGTIGAAYSTTLATTGGSGVNAWSITSGTFPSGLSLNTSTGAITGVPDTPATYVFTARVDSSDGQTASKSFTLVVPPPSTYTTITRGLKAGGVVVK